MLGLLPAAGEQLELELAPDQRRQLVAARGLAGGDEPRAVGGEAELAAAQRAGRVADQHRAGRRRRREPPGGPRRLAHGQRRAADRGDDRGPGVDAGAQLDRDAREGGAQRLGQGPAGADRAPRPVLERARVAEVEQAPGLVLGAHVPALAERRRPRLGVTGAQQRGQPLGLEPVGELAEPGDLPGQDRDPPPLHLPRRAAEQRDRGPAVGGVLVGQRLVHARQQRARARARKAARQRQRGAQLECPGALLARDGQRVADRRLGERRRVAAGEQQLAAHPVQLTVVVVRALARGDRQRLADGLEAGVGIAGAQVGVGQQAEIERILEMGAGRARGLQPADDLVDAVRAPAGGVRPAAQHASHRDAVVVAAVARRVDRRLGPAQRLLGLVAAGVHGGELRARRRGAVGARRLLGERNGVARAPQRLGRAAEEPQRQRGPVVAADAGVVAERGRERVVVAGVGLGLERRHAAVGVLERARERPLVEERAGHQLGPVDAELGDLLADADHVQRRRGLAAHLVQRRQREQDRGQRLTIAERLGRRPGALQVVQRLGRRPAVDRHVRLPELRQQLGALALSRRPVGQVLGGGQRALEVGDRLPVRAPRAAVPRREPQEAHRGRGPAARDVMGGDLVCGLGIGAEGGLEPLAHPAVQLGATAGVEQREQHVAVQGMRERERLRGGPVRPLHGPVGLDDPGRGQAADGCLRARPRRRRR